MFFIALNSAPITMSIGMTVLVIGTDMVTAQPNLHMAVDPSSMADDSFKRRPILDKQNKIS
jgi:hypothetical protein